jgi:MoaA/NifB/PqqE/SkfB family radical SAM enzyme
LDKFYEIHFEITDKCFLDCKHCSSILMRGKMGRSVFIDDIVKLIGLLDCKTHLYLTGGEPLFSETILEDIKFFRQNNKNMEIGLFTCGIRDGFIPISVDMGIHLKETGIDDCFFSIYHKDQKIHDYITNRQNAFEMTMKSISNLFKAGIKIKVNLVLNKYNYLGLDEIIKHLGNLGMINEIRLLRLVRGGNAEKNWQDLGISYEEQNSEILKIMENKKKYALDITVAGFPDVFPCRPFANSIKCQAGISLLYVTFEGNLFPCACVKNNKPLQIGHISDLEKIKTYLRNIDGKKYNDCCLNKEK